MDYSFTEQQLALQEKVRAFAEKEVAPISLEMDEKREFSLDLLKKLHTEGYMNIPYGAEYGGAGGDYVDYAIVVEELSRADASTGITLSVHTSLYCSCVDSFGTDEQKEAFLKPALVGGKTGSFGLTEPGAGSDAGGQKTVAVKDGDSYVINGSKIYTTNAAFADYCVVFALTDPEAGTKGISAIIVPLDAPGVKIGANIPRMGICGASNTEVFYEDVKVPVGNLLAEEGKGFKIAMAALDAGRIGVAAQALGIAQGAMDIAVAYVKERKQFGKPIAAFQNTQFKLAEMQMEIDAARCMVYRAASIKSAHQPYGGPAAEAKLFASKTAVDVARAALQMLGGYGYSRKYGIEQKYRDAKITEIYEGTSEVMKMVISGGMRLMG
ncbi:MAG: acyl-CoA dehydrogenase family protein [Clostridiales Family XIII bacterium]|jgi:butyryl-CoA dehydrogenase|nr:acyl-CoA dehydrogenase family protein [Clostridiales Family XIII bacterium]